MTETELRALVRDVIDRHLAGGGPGVDAAGVARPAGAAGVRIPVRAHLSHGQFQVPTPEACVIEPSVPCTHCGYCKSYGH